MLLTKLNLDMRNRAVYRLLNNAHQMHSALCHACGESREDAGILYRIVPDRAAMYVYSSVPLDAEKLPRGLRFAGSRDISPILAGLATGERMVFELLAVPSKKIANPASHNSRRVIIREPAERYQWLERKLAEAGCRLLHVREGRDVTETISARGRRRFRVTGYEYGGTLEVTDPDKFRAAIGRGIGAERAYGYGMLMVQP